MNSMQSESDVTRATRRRAARSQASPSSDIHEPDLHGHAGVEQISTRAYERFLARGGEHGRDMEDWLEAERELSAAGRDPS